MRIENKTREFQFQIVVKSLARFHTQFKFKETFTVLMAIKDNSFSIIFLLLLISFVYLFACSVSAIVFFRGRCNFMLQPEVHALFIGEMSVSCESQP